MDSGIAGVELTDPFVRAAGNPRSLRKWKVLKSWTTRITVIRRFGKKYCSKEIQLSIQDLFEKSTVSEGTSTKQQAAGCAPTSGAPFSPQCPLAEDVPNQKLPRFPTLEHQHGKGLFPNAGGIIKDSFGLFQILLTLLSLQFLPEESLDESTAGLIGVTVVVIVLTGRTEGTTAADLERLVIQISSKKQLLFVGFIITFMISGARAENSIETCKMDPDGRKMPAEMPHYAVVAITLFVGWLTFVVARRITINGPAAVAVAVAGPANNFIMEGLEGTDYRKSNLTLAIPSEIL